MAGSSVDMDRRISAIKEKYPQKFISEEQIFSKINRGDRIFIGTGCGEQQYLVSQLVKYVESHPKAFFDAEVFHLWTLGVAPYAEEKFKSNFRHNSFFIGNHTREAVNEGNADYTPIFISQIPFLLRKRFIPIDVAIVQVSPPDKHGYVSLGISVDITKAAVESADLVIAQMNSQMPRTHGDTFLHVEKIDYIVPYDEPLLEYEAKVPDEISMQIGKYVAKIVQDGDTIQVGYGSIPNAIIAHLKNKKHLGVHTELLTDGIVELMREGVVDNTRKTVDRNKTVASFCMGSHETYHYIHDNPSVELKPVDYTNNLLVIAQQRNMVAINSALQIDLTGQASAESIGKLFYSGIGGSADFMRGAVLAPGGRSILVMQSTARGGEVSRIVPVLEEGSGVTLTRGDLHYVVTEYGIAYLHGRNIRERAMALISIAHPKFRPWLLEEAKKLSFIYKDQAYIPGEKGQYPEYLEAYRTTKTGLQVLLRPVKLTDEPLLKDFFYSLSDASLYRRFMSVRKDMPHERLQEFVVIDYKKEMVILATISNGEKEEIVGVGQYGIEEDTNTAEVALVVRDDYQNKGVGWELLSYLTYLAKTHGLIGFTAEVFTDNRPMLHLFEKAGFQIEKRMSEGVYHLKMLFKEDQHARQ
ncbi:MAG: GNAT family N-acetyltransferase [Thermoplasmata archaeon]